MMRVATFNIRNGLGLDGWSSWPFRRRATLRMIEELDADVIGLQEVYWFQLRWLHRRLPGYKAFGAVGRSGGWRGEMGPVLVRHRWAADGQAVVRWYGDTPEVPGTRLPGAGFPRIATVVTLHHPDAGRPIQVVNTHWDEKRGENRLRSADQLRGWLDPDRPWVVVGDLNARPGSEPLAALARAGLRPVLGPDAGGTAHSFTGRRDGPQIDHVLVSEEWDVVDASIRTAAPGQALPSDHWPIVAQLRLGDRRRSDHRRPAGTAVLDPEV